jgi:hypothetical protein
VITAITLFGAAENLSWGRGSEKEVEAMRNLQRQWLERDRNEQLAKLRAWLLRDCESLQYLKVQVTGLARS